MTAFFVGGVVGGVASSPGSVEDAYQQLREVSHDLAGSPPTSRRIFSLSCRLDGRDCHIEVGRPFPLGGTVVAAIIDHGRGEDFVVHMSTQGERTGVSVRVPHPVYSVTDFS